MTKKNIMIFSVLVAISLIAGGIYYFGIKRKTLKSLFKKRGEVEDEDIKKAEQGVPVVSKFCKRGDDFPIRHGSCGDRVRQLQIVLNKNYNEKLDMDGKYGDDSEDAYKKHFKTKNVSQQKWENDLIFQWMKIKADTK